LLAAGQRDQQIARDVALREAGLLCTRAVLMPETGKPMLSMIECNSPAAIN
jgi:hypothetical protein